jgi:cob(I)alamin adenosyltransferase
MAELASIGNPASPFLGSIEATHVEQLEAWIELVEAEVEMPREFVIPGDSKAGAALHLARTVVRRAERAAVRLADEGRLDNEQVIRYLNRLSSLCFALSILEDRAATSESPTLAKEA